jgi:hypothetical protein
MVGDVLFPGDGEDIWITPFFFREVWHYRRQFRTIDSLIRGTKLPTHEEPDEDIPTKAPIVPMTSPIIEAPLEPTPIISPLIIEIGKKSSHRQSAGQLMFDILIPDKEDKCS